MDRLGHRRWRRWTLALKSMLNGACPCVVDADAAATGAVFVAVIVTVAVSANTPSLTISVTS